MPTTTTLEPEIWQPATDWIRQCQKLGIPIQPGAFDHPQPFINPEASAGIKHLLARSARQPKGQILTLKLTKNQAIGLMNQFDMWAHEEFRLPQQYRDLIPRQSPYNVFKMVSLQLEDAIDVAEKPKR